jgi:aspartyl-tRNA synthetase
LLKVLGEAKIENLASARLRKGDIVLIVADETSRRGRSGCAAQRSGSSRRPDRRNTFKSLLVTEFPMFNTTRK